MSRYRTIDIRMHGDEVVASLSRPQPNARTLWEHLLFGPSTGIIPGLYRAREAQLADELGWELEPFRKCFREVFTARSRLGLEGALAKSDWKAGLVWVPNAIKYNAPANPNVVKHWADALDELPECALKAEAYLALGVHCRSRGPGFYAAFELLPKPSVSSFLNGSMNRMPNQDQDQDQEKEDTSPPAPGADAPKAPAPAPGPATDPVFAHWVSVMGKDPVRSKLNAARKAKLKARRAEGYTDEQLCQAVDGCKLSPFHMGQNDRGEAYNDLTVILRDGATVEKHIERSAPKPVVARVHYLGGMP